MKYVLLGRYFLDQTEDRVTWIRLFPKERKMLVGKGVYRDDVLVLLAPSEVHDIRSIEGVRSELEMDTLPSWNKTRYLIHMGSEKHNYSVDEAIHCEDGKPVTGEEFSELLKRIGRVF